jgi:hypothetical protein
MEKSTSERPEKSFRLALNRSGSPRSSVVPLVDSVFADLLEANRRDEEGSV